MSAYIAVTNRSNCNAENDKFGSLFVGKEIFMFGMSIKLESTSMAAVNQPIVDVT